MPPRTRSTGKPVSSGSQLRPKKKKTEKQMQQQGKNGENSLDNRTEREVIEISPDSGSSSYSDLEDADDATPENKKAVSAEGRSRGKLPVRNKGGVSATEEAAAAPGEDSHTIGKSSATTCKPILHDEHRSFTIEIPLPNLVSKGREAESLPRIPDSQAESGDDRDKVGREEDEVFKTPLATKKSHVKFDEDGDENVDETEVFVTPMEAPGEDSLESAQYWTTGGGGMGDAGDDDDDEAPEAESLHAAYVFMKKREEATLKAVKEHDAAQKCKRQQRDSFFKQQAEKRLLAEAEEAAKVTAAKKVAAEAEIIVRAALIEAVPAAAEGASVEAPEPRRKRKAKVPDLLPLELLESEDEEDEKPLRPERSVASQSTARPSKKMKLEAVGKKGRGPRDKRVGSTVYRVLKDDRDHKLPPEMNGNTRLMREMLLNRKRGPQKSGGFLVRR